MKTAVLTPIFAFATSTAALAWGPDGYGHGGGSWGGWQPPPPPFLTQDEAETIVNKFKSVLEGVQYDGQTFQQTADQVVAENYVERSDSILSLISLNNTLGDGAHPAATTREQWYIGVTTNPTPGIETHKILIAGETNILWYWTFPNVGIRKYPITGFNLFSIDSNKQIAEADIEFNSIAWGVDTFQIQQYCGAPPAGGGPPA